MDSNDISQDNGDDSFSSFGDTPAATTTSGHSTRDAIIGVINNGLNILPQLFGRNQQPPQQLAPAPVYDPGQQVGAGLQVGLGNGGVNVGGGLQLNTTTLLIGGLALALVMMRK